MEEVQVGYILTFTNKGNSHFNYDLFQLRKKSAWISKRNNFRTNIIHKPASSTKENPEDADKH